MPTLLIKAPVYATILGITSRSLTRYINSGMPGARKVKNIWRIDATKAEPWLRENRAQLFTDEPTPMPRTAEDREAEPLDETDEAMTDRHIRRLNCSLDGMVNVLHDGTYNPNLVRSIKQVSGELRLLERHRIDMRRSAAELMTTHEHHQIVATLARVIATELDGLAHSLPEELLACLTNAGCVISKPKTALRAATQAATRTATELRHRIADAIETSTIGDT